MALQALLLPLLPSIMGVVGTIIDRVIPDEVQKEAAKREIETKLIDILSNANMAQLELNKQEAQHQSIFVAGWRPWIGWTLGTALAYQFVASPLIMWGTQIGGLDIPPPPSLDENLWELLTGMLGMAGLRTFEKLKNINTRTVSMDPVP